MFTRLINNTETCGDYYNCCNCGGENCGCAYCWSCKACENCQNDAGICDMQGQRS